VTLDQLKQKKVGILGYGQEGQAVARYLLNHGITPVVFDKQQLSNVTLETVNGNDYLAQLNRVEVIFRSPGIWRLHPEIVKFEQQGGIVTSQTKWFFAQARGQIIGVTGTKGKGTTCSLIHHFLQVANLPAQGNLYLTGNIGKLQPLDFLDELQPHDLVVYELSSFQLQDLDKSPHIGIVLMVTSDHLDHHRNLEEYHQAKAHIVSHQSAADFAIINDDNPVSRNIGSLSRGQKLYFSRRHPVSTGAYIENGQINIVGLPDLGEQLAFPVSLINLPGQHNWENVSAAILAGLLTGVRPEVIRQALPEFHGLPHRLELVHEHQGIKFYDDSIATVPETSIAAIKSFTEPVIAIVGGSDKGAEYNDLAGFLSTAPNAKAVVLIGTTASKIKQSLLAAKYQGTILDGFTNFKDALQATKQLAAPGDVVLLSPGCASFDWFKNYQARGDEFKQLVQDWPNL
jgi:UDP-N-acetylmuramoylalanine--D-glutamate ligase